MKERVRRLVDGLFHGKSQEHLLLLRHPGDAAQRAALLRREHSPTKVQAPLHRRQLDVNAWGSIQPPRQGSRQANSRKSKHKAHLWQQTMTHRTGRFDRQAGLMLQD